MIDKETYKRELVRMWDSMRDDKYKGRNNCEGVICSECQFCDINDNDNDCYEPINAVEMVEAVEKWSKEHPKHKLTEFENDIIFTVLRFGTGDEKFSDYDLLMKLLKEGYYPGAKPSDKIADYIENCEDYI